MTVEILLLEDSPGDIRLTQEAFRAAHWAVHLHVASDGMEAINVLKREGHPAASNIAASYHLGANCYATKLTHPDDLDRIINYINNFWLGKAQLPASAMN